MKPYRGSSLIKSCGALVAIATLLLPAAFGATCYVDQEVTGADTGLKWTDAFTTIQPAIDDAFDDGGSELWVGEGTYTSNTDPVVTMKENVHLYGGFSRSETAGSDRDWNEYETIIDGENARRCVVGANNASLGRFTVTRGCSGFGGGMYNTLSSSPAVINCTFTGKGRSFNHGKQYLPERSEDDGRTGQIGTAFKRIFPQAHSILVCSGRCISRRG